MMRYWNQMSSRERGLALGVVALLLCGMGYTAVSSALEHLSRQEADIDRLEQQLVNFSRHIERQRAVDAAFGQIAAQHSSEWSGEEIYDRLGSEIYRLAREEPGEPGSPGSGPEIIPIPQLPPGELLLNPDGYRNYRVEFKTGDTTLTNLSRFLRRIEESPQALRIELLDIRRAADQQGMAQATIRVNRTVVDGVEEAADAPVLPDDAPMDFLPEAVTELAVHGSFEKFSGTGDFEGWVVQACTLSPATAFVTDGLISVKAEPLGSGAFLSQPIELAGGSSYEMTLDMQTSAPVSIAVVDEMDDLTYDGVIAVSPNGDLRSYRIQFTVAGSGMRTLQAPFISFEESEGTLYLDRVRIRRLTGAK